MIDKRILSQRFAKAFPSYDAEAIVQKQIADKLIDYIKKENLKNITNILEIGCGTGLLSKKILGLFQPENIYLNDICQEIYDYFVDYLNQNITTNNIFFLLGDAEKISFPNEIDLIISSATFQWFDDLEKFIKKCTNSFKNSGYLVFSTFGNNNLREIKQITGRGLKYYSKDEIKLMLSNDYDIKLIHIEEKILLFDTPRDVLLHLKRTGVTAVSSNSNSIFWAKNKLETFINSYSENFRYQNKVTLTYNPIYVLAKKI